MPLYFTPSVGPFRYVRRVGPRRRGVLFWVAVGWWWCPMVAMLQFGVALCRGVWDVGREAVRYARARSATAQHRPARRRA